METLIMLIVFGVVAALIIVGRATGVLSEQKEKTEDRDYMQDPAFKELPGNINYRSGE